MDSYIDEMAPVLDFSELSKLLTVLNSLHGPPNTSSFQKRFYTKRDYDSHVLLGSCKNQAKPGHCQEKLNPENSEEHCFAYTPDDKCSKNGIVNRQKLDKLDRYYLAVAQTTASMRSKDPKTKVGAIILSSDGLKMSVGYNGFPKGFPDTAENWLSENKHNFVIHAEANCLLNCPFESGGCSVYCTHKPCINCLKLLINAGISRIVYTERLEWENAHNTIELQTLYNFYVDSGKELVAISN